MVDWFSIILIVIGLTLFEVIISIDNAIINAEVLGTMSKKARRWFLLWGILIAVFLVRGLLPWTILWILILVAIIVLVILKVTNTGVSTLFTGRARKAEITGNGQIQTP